MKIALVCSHGGHLTEMIYLAEAFEGYDIFFVTYDCPRTQALRYRKYLFRNFGEKKIEMIKNIPKILKILLKERPKIIVSNGAELAIPFFYFAKLFKMKTIFIECYTRIDEPTVTGRVVYPVSDLFLVLWPDMLAKYGKKANYWGGLFEVGGFRSSIQNEKEDMIFVIVGTHYQGFERLVKKMDEVSGKVSEKVVIQIGNTQYVPKNAEYFRFKADDEDIKALIKNARIVVCQGAMAIMDSLMLGTPVIAVPRLKKFGEHINDHQLIFARKLEELELVKVVEDINELENIILSSTPLHTKNIVVNRNLITRLKNFVENYKIGHTG